MDQFLDPETDTKHQFLDPETVGKCQFLVKILLDPETDIMDQFLDPETDIKHQFLVPEIDKKCQFLDGRPETDVMDQFLDPETDIMGEGNYIIFGPNHLSINISVLRGRTNIAITLAAWTNVTLANQNSLHFKMKTILNEGIGGPDFQIFPKFK